VIITYLHKLPDGLKVPENHFWSADKNRNNEAYLAWLEILLKSIQATNPDRKVLIKATNFLPEEIARVKMWNRNLIVEEDSANFTDLSANQYILYYLRYRLSFIKEKIQEYNKVIFVDVDTIIRKDIQPIYDMLDKSDFIIRDPDGAARRGGVGPNAGVMGFSGRRASLFIEEIENELRLQKKISTYTTQRLLYSVRRKMVEADKLSHEPLPHTMNDMSKDFSEDSIIWHGNRGNKFKNLVKFKNELENLT